VRFYVFAKQLMLQLRRNGAVLLGHHSWPPRELCYSRNVLLVHNDILRSASSCIIHKDWFRPPHLDKTATASVRTTTAAVLAYHAPYFPFPDTWARPSTSPSPDDQRTVLALIQHAIRNSQQSWTGQRTPMICSPSSTWPGTQ
jgi:hypothetical protein